MNRSNPFRFDLRNGIRFIAKKFLVLPLLVSLVCFEFMLRLRETASLNHQYAGAQPTLGDFAMYLFGGMKPYIPNPDEPFLFPVSWFLVFGICLFLTLYYPVYDRDTFGKMVIVYSGSRTKWWTAKCAWIIVATFLYFFLCWILLLINCLLYGGQFTLSVSPYMSDIFLLRETIPPDQWNVCHVLLLMPPLIASSFGILQMLLTLWFRPIGLHDTKYKKYSLGMKQRLGIAAAVFEQPDIILLDEPTNALDESGITMLENVIQDETSRGATIVMASHDMNFLHHCCSKIYTMRAGTLSL